MEHHVAGHPCVSVGRTAELSALLFGTTELAHLVADVLGDTGGGPGTEVIDLRERVGTAAPSPSAGA